MQGSGSIYTEYRNKMLVWTKVWKVWMRFRIYILSALALVAVVTGVLLGTSGIVYDDVGDNLPSIVYGQQCEYDAKAFLKGIDGYMYCRVGTDEWSTEAPVDVGDYLVRGFSTRLFGGKSYGPSRKFTIAAKKIKVAINEEEIQYGVLPTVQAQLVDGDVIACTAFDFEDIVKETTEVFALQDAITIVDANGRDVTANYELETPTKTIKFLKRSATVTTADGEFVYDGTAHTREVFDVDGLADGDRVVATFVAQTVVGSYQNTATFAVLNADDKDVSGHYDITATFGSIGILQRQVKLSVEDKTKFYDGTPLYNDIVAVSDQTPLVDGHTLSVSSYTEITDVGTVDNMLTFVVSDVEGNDLTANYVFDYGNPTLTVASRTVVVTSDGASKVYDATPLTCDMWSIAEGTLADGHTATVEFGGTQTDVGTSENTFVVHVIDETGGDVTDNYDIVKQYGTLEVTLRPIKIVTATNEWVYDGQKHSDPSNALAEDSQYALVEGHVSAVTACAEITDVGSTQNAITVAVYQGETDVTANYSVEIVCGTLSVTVCEIHIATSDWQGMYDGQPHDCTDWYYTDKTEHYLAEGHTLQADGNQATIAEPIPGQTENRVAYTVVDGNGQAVNPSNYNIVYDGYGTLYLSRRYVSITSDSASLVYDGAEHSLATYKVDDGYSFVEGHTVVATATQGITDVGEITNILAVNVFDGDRDVTAFYDIAQNYGTLSIYQRHVTIVTATAQWVYDGDSHSDASWTYATDSEYKLVDGHTLANTYLTSITDVGSVDNVAFYDIWASETSVWNNYNLEINFGTLTVAPRPVTFKSGSDSKVYDDALLVCDTYEITDGSLVADHTTDGNFVKGHTANVSFVAAVVNVGEWQNTFEVAIVDGNGIDVTANYAITRIYGTLTVVKRTLKVVSGSQTWTYNGYANTCSWWNYDESTEYKLVENHSALIAEYTEITDVGSCENKLTLLVYSAYDVDVTKNYDIVFVRYGTLTVEKRNVNVSTWDWSEVYRGEPMSFEYYCTVDETTPLADNQYLSAIAETITWVTNVADSGTQNKVQYNVVDQNGKDVTSNYEITYTYGVITVLPREVELQTASDSWTFDGEMHSAIGCNATENSPYDIVAWHTAVALSGYTTITHVGSEQNKVAYKIVDKDGNDVTENYLLTYVYGELSVTPRPITITSCSADKVYDGTPLVCWQCDVTIGNIVSYHSISATYFAEITDVGELANKFSVEILDVNDGDKYTYDYEITYVYGVLKVTPRTILVDTASKTWVYDGETHSYYEWNYNEETQYYPLDGHTIECVGGLSVQNVWDISLNMLSFAVYADGKDVTNNYEITIVNYGILTITQRTVTITTDSYVWVYDGQPHKCVDWQYGDTLYEFVVGQRVEVDGTTITDVGSVENVLTMTVYDQSDNDVTPNYNIVFEAVGTLTVTLRTVELRTLSQEFVYDGTEQTCTEYEIALGSLGFVDTHFVVAISAATVKNVGDVAENVVQYVVYDELGNDVTANYNIVYVGYGTLTVVARQLTIAASDSAWIYDGQTHTAESWQITNGSLAVNQQAIVTLDGAIKYVWENDVMCTVSARIVDESGNDVTANYDLTFVEGKLHIDKRTVTVQTASDGWVYDDLAHSNAEYYIVSALGFVDGETVIVSEAISVRYVKDSCENLLTYAIFDDQIDVTDNYDLQVICGWLSIIPRAISVSTGDGEWKYDGTAHGNTAWNKETNLVDGTIVDGQSIAVTVTGNVTDVWECYANNNDCVVAVFDGDGNDVTENYAIGKQLGTLTITPRVLTVRTLDFTFVYDGTEHAYTEWQYDGTQDILVDGEQLVAYYGNYTTITNVGEVVNEVNFSVVKADGADSSGNYRIAYAAYGTLYVTKRTIYIDTPTRQFVYDGTAHYATDFATNEASPYGIVDGQQAGAYDGYATITDVGSVSNVFTPRITANGADVTANYDILVLSYGTLSVTVRKITVTTATRSWQYDADEHFDTTPVVSRDSDMLAQGHKLAPTSYPVVSLVTDGVVENNVVYAVMSGDKDVTSNYEITYVYGTIQITARRVTLQTDGGSWTYDGLPHSAPNFDCVSGSVVDGQQIVATLDWLAVTTVADTGTRGVDNANTFAIFADGIDVSDNYEIKTRFQKLRIIARAITVSTGDGEWKYDGMAHANTAWDETVDLDGTLADGQKIIVTVTGSVTDVSDTKKSNNGCNVAIVDANGNDVTANYTVKKQLGTLTITPRYIKLKTLDYSAVYDGAKHSYTEWEYDDGTIDRIVDGQMLTAKSGKFATIENVGSVQNVIDFDVKYGTKIVTKNYNIEYVSYGTLTLTKREVWVATDSDTRVYDGAAHYKATYTVCEDSPYQFVAKQRVSVSSYTSITNVGTVINALTLTVKNSGKDVTDNYEIVYKTYGSLTVTPRKVTVRTATTQFEYDGQPHFDVNATVAAGSYGLVRGHNFEATYYPTVTVVADGEVTNNVVYLVKNGEEDVTANYEIVYGYGKISVVPRRITVQTSSCSWTYDGLAHSAQGYEVVGGSLVELQQLIATSAWTTVTTVAETAPFGKQNINTFAIFADEKDVSENYAIGVVYGNLYIAPREITVCTENGMWVYDGQKHEHTYWSMEDLTQGTLAEGQTIVVTVLGAVTNVWDTYEGNNVCEVTVFDGNGNDVTANYAVTTQCGTLTILPRNVKVITLDDTHVYDGNQHYNIDWKYDDTTEYKLVDGHALQPIDWTTLVDVGSAENIVEFAVSDGMADVSQNYAIEYTHYGTITVQTRTVTLTTATNEWVYDGNAHSDIGYVLTEGSLDFVFGQTIDSLDRNEITSVGSVQNVLKYVVCDVSGNDVTANYNIVYVGYGTLTVTPREVWLQTATNAWKYDGTEHFDTTAEVLAESPFGLAEGHSFLDTSHVNITNVGYIDNIVDYIVVDGDGKDVSANYTLVRSYGGLSVTLRNITLKSASDRWCYDGQPHANDAYEITSGSIADGQTLVAELSVTVTECEVKTNEFGTVKVFANGVDVTENYEITLVVGELQVYKARVVVEMYQLSKEYDGKPLAITEDDYEISETESENLANCRVEVVWLAEKFVDAGTITPDQINERAEVRVYDQDGNDITEQCVVDFVGSTLTIHKRSITITAVSESKIYDGTPLKATTFVVSSGELAEGDVLTVTSTAEITRPGVVVISIGDTNVEITRGENSARDNYEITYVDGILTVLES